MPRIPTDRLALPKVAVVGLGSWGTAIASLAAPHVGEVWGWDYLADVVEGVNRDHRNPSYATGCVLPDNVHATSEISEAVAGADAVLVATPSAFLRSTCRRFADVLDLDTPVLVLAKGIERETGLLVYQVAADELGREERVALISGPNHSEEIVRGLPAATVCGAASDEIVEVFRSILGSERFRIYGSRDRVGVGACGALKNVVAIACGIACGMGLGDNTVAVLMTRGLAEMTRIAYALGAEPITCMGLAGMGDLVTTCISPHSRNRSFGQAFVAGETLAGYEARTSMVVEGYRAAASAHDLASRLGVEAPLMESVYRVLYEDSPLDREVAELLSREPRTEFYGIVDEAVAEAADSLEVP